MKLGKKKKIPDLPTSFLFAHPAYRKQFFTLGWLIIDRRSASPASDGVKSCAAGRNGRSAGRDIDHRVLYIQVLLIQR